MKRKIFLILLAALMLIVTFSCTVPSSAVSITTEENHPIFKNEIVSKEEYLHNIINTTSVNFDEFLMLIKSDSKFYIFIGTDSCPYCRNFSPNLYQFSLTTENTIYYFDLNRETATLTETERSKLKEVLKDTLEFQGIPYIGLIQDGNLLKSFTGDETTLNDLNSMENM